jgi:hypothetical protein
LAAAPILALADTQNVHEIVADEVIAELTEQLRLAGYTWKDACGFNLEFPLLTKVRQYSSIWTKQYGFFVTVFTGKDKAHSSITDYTNFCTKTYSNNENWLRNVSKEIAKRGNWS